MTTKKRFDQDAIGYDGDDGHDFDETNFEGTGTNGNGEVLVSEGDPGAGDGDVLETESDELEDGHDEVAPPQTETGEEGLLATQEQLDAEYATMEASDLPEFNDEPDPTSEELEAELEGDSLENYPEAGEHQPEFFGAIAGAAASILADQAIKHGPRIAKKTVRFLSKKARRRLKKARLPKNPVVRSVFRTFRNAETSSAESFGDSFTPQELETAQTMAAQLEEIVIGTDDRVRVRKTKRNPWRKVVALRITACNGKVFRGSGFFIGPDTIATAGHCVYLHDHGGWAKKIEVIPAANGSQRPYGTWKAVSMRSVSGWTKRRSPEHDYAAIRINSKKPGKKTGYFGLRCDTSGFGLIGKCVTIAGYPGDKPFAQLWKANDQILFAAPQKLVYLADSMGGMSGGPVFVTIRGKRQVVGIHNYGSFLGNSATRINTRVYRNLRRWARTKKTESAESEVLIGAGAGC